MKISALYDTCVRLDVKWGLSEVPEVGEMQPKKVFTFFMFAAQGTRAAMRDAKTQGLQNATYQMHVLFFTSHCSFMPLAKCMYACMHVHVASGRSSSDHFVPGCSGCFVSGCTAFPSYLWPLLGFSLLYFSILLMYWERVIKIFTTRSQYISCVVK